MRKMIRWFLLLVLVVILYIGWQAVTFDEHAKVFTQNYINTNLKGKNFSTLNKKSSDHFTYRHLREAHSVKLKLLSDNQGSRNLMYFPVAINGVKNYWVTLKVDSWIPNHFEMVSIKHYK